MVLSIATEEGKGRKSCSAFTESRGHHFDVFHTLVTVSSYVQVI